MVHVYIEPEVRYFDIIVDSVEPAVQMSIWLDLIGGEDTKALGIRKIGCLPEEELTIRVFLEADTHSEGLRTYLCDKLTGWFNQKTTFEATRSRLSNRHVILLNQLEPTPA